nr:hypothetical protein [uncultured Desulfobacter sp.]
MSKSLVTSIFLIVCIFSNVVFAADKEKKEIPDLTPWKGINVSIATIYDQEGGEKYFEKVAEHAPEGYTVEKVKDHILGSFSADFKSLNIMDENTIIIDDKFTGDYVYVGDLSTKLYKYNVTWQIFKTDSKEMIQAGYKYFLFLPFHQHGEDGLRHTHLRYGNENFDFLTTDPSLYMWVPTVYQPAETDEAKILAQMIKGAKLRGKNLPPLEKAVNE